MLVFHNQNLVIFAIPKTGSTALETALAPFASIAVQSPPAQRHMNWGSYAKHWAPVLRQSLNCTPQGVAILRDPLDRLRSWYRYRSLPQFDGTEMSAAEMSFDAFIEASLLPTPPRSARIGAQDTFVMSRTGKVQVHHLFDHAQMPIAVDWLSQRLGREIVLERRNDAPERPASLDPTLEERFRTARSREFALYARVADQGHLVSRADAKGN